MSEQAAGPVILLGAIALGIALAHHGAHPQAQARALTIHEAALAAPPQYASEADRLSRCEAAWILLTDDAGVVHAEIAKPGITPELKRAARDGEAQIRRMQRYACPLADPQAFDAQARAIHQLNAEIGNNP